MIKNLSTLLIIFTISACASNLNNKTPKEKEIIGQDVIDDGGKYFGFKIGRHGNYFCEYSTKFGNKTFVKRENNEICAK